MVRENEIRTNEHAFEGSLSQDALLTFIGRIHTPWISRLDAPRQGRADGPICRIEVFEPWAPALRSLDRFERVYWLHLSRRDLVLQSPANDGEVHGTFSLRSPVRPNPIGTAIAHLVAIDGNVVLVRGLDCLDGTPLLDLKPDRTLFTPIGVTTRKCSERPVRANNAGTHAASSEGFSRSGLSRPGAGCASSVQM